MTSQRSRPVDIRTVAQRAGVSIATVSRVMNKVFSVDARLVARVVKAAKELNYRHAEHSRRGRWSPAEAASSASSFPR